MTTIELRRIACKCDRCGHVWAPRPGRATVPNAGPLPRICPKCKRDDWHLVGKALAVLAFLALAGCATTGTSNEATEEAAANAAWMIIDILTTVAPLVW